MGGPIGMMGPGPMWSGMIGMGMGPDMMGPGMASDDYSDSSNGFAPDDALGGTVVVFCRAGMHRSVAMAEKLARTARGWMGVRVRLRHLDLGRRMREQGML